jgi:hypothetical protein
MPVKRFFIIRHFNEAFHRFSQDGEQQAKVLAEKIKALSLDPEKTALISATQERAKKSARLIGELTGLGFLWKNKCFDSQDEMKKAASVVMEDLDGCENVIIFSTYPFCSEFPDHLLGHQVEIKPKQGECCLVDMELRTAVII